MRRSDTVILVVLFALALWGMIALLWTARAAADAACWTKQECTYIYPCWEVWTDGRDQECSSKPINQHLHPTSGRECKYSYGAGADSCVESARWEWVGPGPWANTWHCELTAYSNLIQLGCCTSPCPPGTPWCQEN